MIPQVIPPSIKKRIDDALSKPKKQTSDNDAVIKNISDTVTKQFDLINKLFANQTLSIQQMFANQIKIQSANRKSDNKKIDDKINNIKLDCNIGTGNKQTYIYEKDSHYVASSLNILNLKGSGTIEEILIKSQTSDFTIIIDIDKMEQYQRTWSELNEISEDLDGMVAVNRNGIYIVKLSNLHFKNKIKMMMSTGGATFDKIYVRCSYV